MCIYMNIGQCITKLQSGRDYVHGRTDGRTDGKRHNIIRPVGRIKNAVQKVRFSEVSLSL